AGMPVLRCRTFPSVLPCFIHGQECPCSVIGHPFNGGWAFLPVHSRHALSTGRNARAPLSDICLITEDGHSCPSTLAMLYLRAGMSVLGRYPSVPPCFIYGQNSPFHSPRCPLDSRAERLRATDPFIEA